MPVFVCKMQLSVKAGAGGVQMGVPHLKKRKSDNEESQQYVDDVARGVRPPVLGLLQLHERAEGHLDETQREERDTTDLLQQAPGKRSKR